MKQNEIGKYNTRDGSAPTMGHCDKCGEEVPRGNDAVQIESEAFPQNSFYNFFSQSRHFLPTENCAGSPSRAQYIEGQPRSESYPYRDEDEQKWRDAYTKLNSEVSD